MAESHLPATDRCDQVVDITGKYVVPGFVDIHFHGYNLFEFTTGLYDVKSDVEWSVRFYACGFCPSRKQ